MFPGELILQWELQVLMSITSDGDIRGNVGIYSSTSLRVQKGIGLP